MPPSARNLIAMLVGAPCGFARSLGVVVTVVEGTILFGGREEGNDPMSVFKLFNGYAPRGHLEAVATAFGISIVAYLIEVMVRYITAENRLAVAPRRVATLMSLELGMDSLGVLAICMLAGGLFCRGPWGLHALLLILAGAAAGRATVFLFRRFRPRIREWYAAWEKPPASEPQRRHFPPP